MFFMFIVTVASRKSSLPMEILATHKANLGTIFLFFFNVIKLSYEPVSHLVSICHLQIASKLK